MPICLAMSVAPIPSWYSARIFPESIVHLRPNFTPLALASMRPSLVRSRSRWRSAWATADRMVTTILPIVPSVLMPSSKKRMATPTWSNSLIKAIMSAVSRPNRSNFFTRITSPSSTLTRNECKPSRLTWLPETLSVKIRLVLTPASLRALTCPSRDCWLVDTRA